jgi:hypothetical protein
VPIPRCAFLLSWNLLCEIDLFASAERPEGGRKTLLCRQTSDAAVGKSDQHLCLRGVVQEPLRTHLLVVSGITPAAVCNVGYTHRLKGVTAFDDSCSSLFPLR